MTRVSRRWLRILQVSGIVLILLIATSILSLPGAAASEEQNTNRSDQADGSQHIITIVSDGKRVPCIITASVTVEEQLAKMNLSLEQMDTVTPALETVLQEGDVVEVSRRRIEQVVERGVVAHETIYAYSPDVTAGTETVFVTGEDGYGEQTYDVLLVNGKETERTLIKETLEKEPVTEEIGTGFRSTLISPFDFEWNFDANGEPLDTVNVLRGQRSSAYSARVGAKTASGRDAIVGHVAVNPNVIPYGSKLFIQSKDGTYIYGYAVAADTGTALMDGRVAVDIFYGSYQESVNHGIITVDIFVLETA